MAAAAEDEASRLFRVRKTLMQMLRDRGFDVDDEDLSMNRNQFVDKFGESVKREDLVIHKAKTDNSTDQIFVFFPNDAKVGIKSIRPYIERMKQENVMRAIIVAQQSLTPSANKSIQDIFNKTYQLEVFMEAELLVNITEHELVPRHCLLTNNQKKEVLEHYTLKETQLPRILVSDPVARYYGLRRGQVVKIIRKSETAGEYITYRYVI